jgi:hypothetical protein
MRKSNTLLKGEKNIDKRIKGKTDATYGSRGMKLVYNPIAENTYNYKSDIMYDYVKKKNKLDPNRMTIMPVKEENFSSY